MTASFFSRRRTFDIDLLYYENQARQAERQADMQKVLVRMLFRSYWSFVTTNDEMDVEILAMAEIGKALSHVKTNDARKRVMLYVLARYFPDGLGEQVRPLRPSVTATSPVEAPVTPAVQGGVRDAREIPGIARVSDNGDIQLTVRDLKARSRLDAAYRLALVMISASEVLTAKPLSSRKGLTPALKLWRVYDGNARQRIAKDKGILRDGDNLTLDAHAKRDAERIVEEILNPEVKGVWKP